MRWLVLFGGMALIVFLFSFWEVEEKLESDQLINSAAAAELKLLLEELVRRADGDISYRQASNELLSPQYLAEFYPELASHERISYNEPWPGHPGLAIFKAHHPKYELFIYFDGRVDCFVKQ